MLETREENIKLSEEEKLRRLKNKNGIIYCMCCNYSGRMEQKDYGFKCPYCGNEIGYNLMRLQESPLNNLEYVKGLKLNLYGNKK